MTGKWIVTLLTLTASSAQADLVVTFRDGAPKDVFTLTNSGSCVTEPFDVTLDLSPAPAGLIFDITASGQGVAVFQPFELTSGDALLRGTSTVTDGDQALLLSLTRLAPGDGLSFTIDLDDTGGGSETIVSGAEIAGAVVQVTAAGTVFSGTFGANGEAVVQLGDCIS